MADSFLDKYTVRIGKVEKRLRSYLEDPNEEHVHDLRTAIRRMSAALDALPRDIRNEDRTQDFLSRFRKLAKQNTRVRDLDIIVSKLAKHEKDPAIERLLKNMLEERKNHLEPALGLAREVEGAAIPSLKKRDVSGPAVQRRLDKIAERLRTRINSRLPKVLHDPTNVEELHLLRIDARKLR